MTTMTKLTTRSAFYRHNLCAVLYVYGSLWACAQQDRSQCTGVWCLRRSLFAQAVSLCNWFNEILALILNLSRPIADSLLIDVRSRIAYIIDGCFVVNIA